MVSANETTADVITLDGDDEVAGPSQEQRVQLAQTTQEKRSARIEKGGDPAQAATEVRSTTDDDDRLSEAGSSKSFKSDSVDPAVFAPLVDEEDNPAVDSVSSGNTAKGKSSGGTPSKPYLGSGGGFSAMKQDANGQYYTGMGIGMSHTWNYNPGVWKETKKEPDLWEIDFETNKVRNHNAPTGSGAPVGTQYHWLIVSHQMVEKISANEYTTKMTGSKYKLAHRGVGQNWSVNTVKGQREREIALLQDAIDRIKGLPPVTKQEKVHETKREKGQATLNSFFGASPSKDKRKAGTSEAPASSKKAKTKEGQ